MKTYQELLQEAQVQNQAVDLDRIRKEAMRSLSSAELRAFNSAMNLIDNSSALLPNQLQTKLSALGDAMNSAPVSKFGMFGKPQQPAADVAPSQTANPGFGKNNG